jgi:hypothetical protein
MGFIGRFINGFLEAKTPQFYNKAGILGYIQMCESLYKEYSRQFPNRDPHQLLVLVYARIKVKSGMRESDLGATMTNIDIWRSTLKPACLPPPLCARALAYTLILRDENLSRDFMFKDDFSPYYNEWSLYLMKLNNVNNGVLKDIYCKYNKNVEVQQAMFEDV